MAERRPTRDQRALLGVLTAGPLDTREIAKLRGHWATYDGTHSSLARLEKRGMVTRTKVGSRVARWSLTDEGRSHTTS